MTPGRVFVREGALVKLCRKIPKKRWFVLFNNALIYGQKEDNANKIKFHRLLELNSSSRVKELPDKKGSTPNGFQVDPKHTVLMKPGYHKHKVICCVCRYTSAEEILGAKLSKCNNRTSRFRFFLQINQLIL